jgi:hypothetical protein
LAIPGGPTLICPPRTRVRVVCGDRGKQQSLAIDITNSTSSSCLSLSPCPEITSSPSTQFSSNLPTQWLAFSTLPATTPSTPYAPMKPQIPESPATPPNFCFADPSCLVPGFRASHYQFGARQVHRQDRASHLFRMPSKRSDLGQSCTIILPLDPAYFTYMADSILRPRP